MIGAGPPSTSVSLARRLARHLVGYVAGLLLPVRLSASERAFIVANRTFWTQRIPTHETRGDLMVEPISHPMMLHANASFAALVASLRGLRLLFVVGSHADRRTKALLGSYPGARFVHLHSPATLPSWLAAWVRAARVYRRLRDPGDILALEERGHRYGDTIYDALLARGYATVRSIDVWTLITLQRYFFYEARIAQIADRYGIRTYISGHSYIGLLQGTFARAMMRRRIEVLYRAGTRQLIVRKYRGPEEIGVYALRPEPSVFSAIVRDPTGEAARHAAAYLERRFAQAVDDPAARLAFDRNRHVYTDAASFANKMSLDPERPVVFVMLHAFNDYPHSHFRQRFMFQDYYEWFVQTLGRARSVTSVNWVFKEHPAAPHYATKDANVGEIMAGVAEQHIRFLPHDADFNAASLRKIAHAIVTCIGSAGMEHASSGVPCVVVGEGPYTGYGFTCEPPDVDSYLRTLDRIADLKRLTEEQQRIAGLIAWYQLGLLHDLPNVLCPSYDYAQIVRFHGVDVWGDAARLLTTIDAGTIRSFRDAVAEFLRTDTYVQILNLTRYPFLREAVGLAD